MARAPDARMKQARDLFLEGKKMIEISELLKIPEGTIRSWKNRYDWDNATLQKRKRNVAKRKGGQLETKMLLERVLQKKIRMQLLRESLRLSFLIAWIRKSSVWCR
nr:phage terminase small subunit-related protein [Clostridium sp. OM04-12AA]